MSIGTSVYLRRALDALRSGNSGAEGAVNEFAATFTNNLERFRVVRTSVPYDELVIESIDALRAPRDEVVQLLLAVSQYAPRTEFVTILCRFFERLVTYALEPPNTSSYNNDDLDNYCFICHELFLYAIAVLLKYERFGLASELLDHRYYLRATGRFGQKPLVNYTVLQQPTESLQARNNRLDLQRMSLRADIIAQRVVGSGIELRELMQADFVLWARSHIQQLGPYGWYPECLIFHRRQSGPFELFARAASKKFFDAMKCVLGVGSLEEIDGFLKSNEMARSVRELRGIDPQYLMCRQQLATLP